MVSATISGAFQSGGNSPTPATGIVVSQSAGGSEAVATNTLVVGGGELIVEAGGYSQYTVVSGGTAFTYGQPQTVRVPSEELVSGGLAVDTTVSSGGEQVVAAGTTVSTIVLSGGLQLVEQSSSYNVIATGTASATTIDGGTLEVLSGGIVSDSVVFTGKGGSLVISASGVPQATILGFSTGDSIFLASIAYNSGDSPVLGARNVLTVSQTTGGEETFNLDPTQNFSGYNFHLAAFGLGTVITATACYCRGTHILSEDGQRLIEHFAIGDIVVTVSGERRTVKWIGRRRYAGRQLTGRKHLLPVRIAAGALGNGMPHRDLRVSPLHAMLLRGVLVPAWQILNGVSIVQETDCQDVEYIHIELETHDVIWAEGAASETFVDDDSRGIFQNAVEYDEMYSEKNYNRTEYSAPRVESGADLESIRRDLMAIGRIITVV